MRKPLPLKMKIYVAVVAVLYATLLVFHCLSIVGGYRIYGQDGPYALPIGCIQVGLTATSFLFAVILFVRRRLESMNRVDFFPLYFLFVLIADVFFSLTSVPLGGHIGFLCAYFLFFVIRRGSWREGIVIAVIASVALVLFSVSGKLTPILGVDCFLGATLLTNLVFSWIRFAKGRDRGALLLAIALSMILVSDGAIALRAFIGSFPLNHVISMVVWPTYVVGNALLLVVYSLQTNMGNR